MRTSTSILGLHGWQTVDATVDLLDGAIECRAANELDVMHQRECFVY